MTAVAARQHCRRNFMIVPPYARGMTTATRSVAVVATWLPTTDRRALSQAWFSALHGTTVSAPPPAARCALPGRERSAPVARPVPEALAGAGTGANGATRSAGSRDLASGPVSPERRAPATDLTRRIERAIVRQSVIRPMGVAAIAVKAADGRIHLLVRTEAGSTRIIALCAPHLRERVDRALAAARFALATTGTRPPAEVAP